MSQAYGYNSFFGWAEQVAYATPVTPPAKWVECESIAVSDERKLTHKPLLGHLSRRRVIRSKHGAGVTLKFPMQWAGVEQLLKHALGGVVTTGAGPIYTHTYALSADLPIGLTGYVDIDDGAISGDHVQQIVGAQIDKMTLTQEMDGTLDCELEMVGREWLEVARTAPTLPAYAHIDYQMMTFATINPSSANLETAIRKWKLEVNNNLYKDKFRLTGVGKRAGFGRAGPRSIMFEAEVEYESDDVLSYYKNATSTDLSFKWLSNIAAGSRELVITTPAGYFQGSRPGASDGGPVYLTMGFDSLASAADNDELAVVFKTITDTV